MLSACVTTTSKPVSIEGVIISSFENFSFVPCNENKEGVFGKPQLWRQGAWINRESANAVNWNLFKNIHDPLLEQEYSSFGNGKGFPVHEIYITAIAQTEQAGEHGFGHLSAWKEEITFKEILEVRLGNCEDNT